MKALYKRWLIVGLSLSIFALSKLKKTLEADIESVSEGSRDGQAPDLNPIVSPVFTSASTVSLSATTVTLSGTVIRNGGRFVLRETAGILYTLDSTGRAWPFEGEDVRVTGHLDTSTSLLHVEDIRAMAS